MRATIWTHAAGILTLAAEPATWPWVSAGLLANHSTLGLIGMRPRSSLLGPNLTRLPPVATRRREVVLTFDDGPDPDVTPAILDILAAHGATASFFLVGERATRHPALCRAILRHGHSVENHTHRHPNAFACWSPGAMRREILRAQQAITDAAGAAPGFFRAPAGLRSPMLDPVLSSLGLRYVSWTRRGRDTVCGNARTVLRRLADPPAAGDILLLHDRGSAACRNGRPVVTEVLPELLRRIAAQRLSAVSLPRAMVGSLATPAAAACPAPAACASP